jgi:hypothetical protein
MADSIEHVEGKRAALLKELANTGDMRRGSLTETYRPCGKTECACTARDHPGHGPFYAFTRKVGGKTQTVQLRPGARLTKLEREVERYRQFRQTCQELVDVNETLCELRPVEDDGEAAARRTLKKKSPRASRRRARSRSSG